METAIRVMKTAEKTARATEHSRKTTTGKMLGAANARGSRKIANKPGRNPGNAVERMARRIPNPASARKAVARRKPAIKLASRRARSNAMVAVGNPAGSKVAADKVKPRNVINRRKTNQRHRALAAASKEPPRGTETAGNKHRANLRSKEGAKGLRKQVSREMQRPEMGIVGTRQRMAASVIAARVR
jgi:hypothetical protein